MKTGKDKEILQEIFEKYHVKDKKLQHDLLACKEGLIKLKLLNVPSKLVYQALKPYNTGLKRKYDPNGEALIQKLKVV